MVFILLPITFLGLFHLCNLSSKDWRNNLLIATVLFSILCLIITEGLSIFTVLTFGNVALIWTLIVFGIGLSIYRKPNQSFFSVFPDSKQFTSFEKKILGGMGFFCGLIFLQGLIYPPNNWDSLSYHLVRVVHWISNNTVAHYPAQDYRQIHQSPFGEYLITHLNLLLGSDYLANSIQWVFLLLLAVGGSLLGRSIGLNRKYQILTAFFIMTIPQVVIQASSTKNDLIAAFFIVTTIHFIITYTKQPTFFNFILIGLATGLAMLTKTTAYLFFFPILLVFGFWFIKNTIQTSNWGNIGKGALIASLALLLNAGFFYRNYDLDKNIFGVETTTDNGYSNTELTIGTFFSSTTRNISLHLAPFPLSIGSEWVVKQLHLLFNLDVNDPKTTFGHTKYKVTNYPNGEGDSPNFGHFLLMIIALVFSLKKRNWKANSLVVILAIIIISQFAFFCLYLKWQPWHTRLHLPIFILSCPLMAFYLQEKSRKIVENIIIVSFALYGLAIITFNSARPLITVPNITLDVSVFDNRHKKLFLALPHLEANYKLVKEIMKKENFKTVAFLNGIDMEYTMIKDINKENIKVYNIDVDNKSVRIPQVLPKQLDCVISGKNQPFIEFRNKKYYNLNETSSYVFIYKSR